LLTGKGYEPTKVGLWFFSVLDGNSYQLSDVLGKMPQPLDIGHIERSSKV